LALADVPRLGSVADKLVVKFFLKKEDIWFLVPDIEV
jgi:hypothetical protein